MSLKIEALNCGYLAGTDQPAFEIPIAGESAPLLLRPDSVGEFFELCKLHRREPGFLTLYAYDHELEAQKNRQQRIVQWHKPLISSRKVKEMYRNNGRTRLAAFVNVQQSPIYLVAY